mmetsp:Transcript_22025/g.44168  ORF Transcript_22025/g.44168 Transcript_22025/m.44168 type:complete len:202 (+) Transcript_22025:330-935(+)
MMPMPSMRPSSTPPTNALVPIARGPARAARMPPVAAPLMIEFQGSSFCRTAVMEQSKHAKRPPQTANPPPRAGPRAFTAERAPRMRPPFGAFLKPLMEWKMLPPTAPIEKAPPTSSTMRHGHGSRSAIDCLPIVTRCGGKLFPRFCYWWMPMLLRRPGSVVVPSVEEKIYSVGSGPTRMLCLFLVFKSVARGRGVMSSQVG